jgi:hypothetical protein
MSTCQQFYVGPYARWLVSEQASARHPFAHLDGIEGVLYDNCGLTDPPRIELDQKSYRMICFMPLESRRGFPGRDVSFFSPILAVLDWSGVDREDEVRQFREVYAEELDKLRDFYGKDPSYHWGLVAFLS